MNAIINNIFTNTLRGIIELFFKYNLLVNFILTKLWDEWYKISSSFIQIILMSPVQSYH